MAGVGVDIAQRTVDVHAHYLGADYVDLLRAAGPDEVDLSQAHPAANLAADLEARFAAMDQAGVHAQILSASTTQPYIRDEVRAVAAARVANDTYANLVRAHPARFAAFAVLPLPHLDASLAELTRAFDDLDLAGVAITTSIRERNPADPHFDPVWRELDRRGGVLFVHPAGNACGSAEIAGGELRMPLGGTLEDTLCAMQLIERGFHQLFPNVRVILAHLGGSLPFLLHRLERSARSWPAERDRPSVAVKRYWYDTCNGHPAALRCACDTFGAERIMLGTDYPYWKGEAHAWAVRYVAESGLAASDVDRILSGNASAFFGRWSHLPEHWAVPRTT